MGRPALATGLMAQFHRTYLMVEDVEASVAFYTEVVGLQAAAVGDRRATLGSGGCSLVLEEDFDAETLSAFGLDPPGEERGDGVILNVEVDDVTAVHDRARGAGADVLAEPREVEWGREILLLADPDGYVVEAARPLE